MTITIIIFESTVGISLGCNKFRCRRNLFMRHSEICNRRINCSFGLAEIRGSEHSAYSHRAFKKPQPFHSHLLYTSRVIETPRHAVRALFNRAANREKFDIREHATPFFPFFTSCADDETHRGIYNRPVSCPVCVLALNITSISRTDRRLTLESLFHIPEPFAHSATRSCVRLWGKCDKGANKCAAGRTREDEIGTDFLVKDPSVERAAESPAIKLTR